MANTRKVNKELKALAAEAKLSAEQTADSYREQRLVNLERQMQALQRHLGVWMRYQPEGWVVEKASEGSIANSLTTMPETGQAIKRF